MKGIAALIVGGLSAGLLAASGQSPAVKGSAAFGPDTHFVWSDGVMSSLARQAEQPWKPVVNTEKQRGSGVEIYAKVAPAVVVVRTETGHGTGFLISPDGRILTNHHVIADGLRHDPQRMASYAMVHLGRIQPDGTMQLQSETVRGYLLKYDPAIDLAMLKIDPPPAAAGPLSSLQFAATAPPPGSPITIIGHPAAGMLWTLRTGQVSSVGRMPGDMVDLVMSQLAATGPQKQQLEAELKRAPSRRIILTSAGANPGDSGGPVVDDTGRVVAVTFAIPSDAGLRRFTYHIHLDEVRAFIASVPASPTLMVPDPWILGPKVELQDANGDRVPDVLVAGSDKPEMMLFDLDNDTPAASRGDVESLIRDRKWDFEFALRAVRSEPTSTAFYDTDNDGRVDLIQTVEDDNPRRNTQFTLTAGRWQVAENVALTFPSPAYLKDPRLAQRLKSLLDRK